MIIWWSSYCCQCGITNDASVSHVQVPKLLQEASQSHDAAPSLAENIMVKHSLKEQRSSLQVTVLEAKGLTPRKGQHVMLAKPLALIVKAGVHHCSSSA